MKKSKILIPAMALLLFSTAASITGTVAWFTSTRVYSMNAGQFEITQLDGNLDVTLNGAYGTTADSNAKTITVNSDVRLVDASVDLSGNVYRLDAEGTNKYKVIDTTNYPEWKVQTFGSLKYHAAVSWTMNISYTFASEGDDMGVYLDLKNSSFTPTGNVGSTGDSAKGFRIMFKSGEAGDAPTVWGNHAPEITAAGDVPAEYDADATEAYAANALVAYKGAEYKCKTGGSGELVDNKVGAFNPSKWEPTFNSSLNLSGSLINLRYVSGTSENSTTDYVTTDTAAQTKVKGNYVLHNDSYPRLSDGAADCKYQAERIATISKTYADAHNHVASATVTCIAWFEGEDPNVVNDTALRTLSANITIYARCDSTTSA